MQAAFRGGRGVVGQWQTEPNVVGQRAGRMLDAINRQKVSFNKKSERRFESCPPHRRNENGNKTGVTGESDCRV